MPYARPLDTLGTEIVLDSGDYARPARQGAGGGRMGRSCAATSRGARSRRRNRRRRRCACSWKRAGSGRSTSVRIDGRYRRRRRGRHRRGLGRARRRDGDRADLRRCARRRLSQASASSTASTDRIDYRHGRLRLARHRHDRRGDAHCAPSALQAKAIEVAAELLQAPAELLDVIDGEVVRSDAAAGPRSVLARLRARSCRLDFASAAVRRDFRPRDGSTPIT